MHKSSELLCAYGGIAFTIFLGAGLFFITGNLIPPSPLLNAAQIVDLFAQHNLAIKIGAALLAFGSMFYWSFAAAIATQMRRIEGAHHALADTQLASASGSVIAVLLAAFIWFAIAFRPDAAAPATAQMLNDLAWIAFIAMYPPAVIQSVAIGLCILSARNNAGVFPHWLGYLNLWAALAFLPGALVPFFYAGPFAWNGLISYWLVATVFSGWIVLMSCMTVQAIKQEA